MSLGAASLHERHDENYYIAGAERTEYAAPTLGAMALDQYEQSRSIDFGGAIPMVDIEELTEPVDSDESAERLNSTQLTDPPEAPPEPKPEPLWIPNIDILPKMAHCESTGRWHINTGNGYYGGLQFSLSSWKAAGGLQFAARPDYATPEQQMLTAEVLLKMQGWKAWPTCSRKLGLR